MNSAQEQLAGEIIQEQSALASDRGNWENLWREIAMRISPSQLQQFNMANLSGTTQGETRTNEMYDSTGATALGRFAAIMDSLLTPRDSKWHFLRATDKALMKDRRVKIWFENATQKLFDRRYSPKANFASQNFTNNEALGAFGTGGLFIDELQGDRGMRYKHIHLSELYIRENHQGIVDTFYRYFMLDARQAAQMFGEKELPEQLRAALKKGSTEKFAFIHRVAQKMSWDPARLDYKGKPYGSCYVSLTGKKLMRESGYRTFPLPVSRYKQSSNELYGRSPAMDVLPALKTLNEMKRQILKQGQRVTDPVLLMHDDGILDSFSLQSGAMNPGGVTADGRLLVHALPTGQIAAGKDLMDDERSDIKDAFLVTLLGIVTENPQMSATEVLERTKEKGMLVAPTVGRQQDERLGPQIERELDILMSQGDLEPMPPALIEAKGDYQIVYDSPLSRAQRAEEASGLMRTVELALQAFNVTQDRAVMRAFNWKKIIPAVADINAVPTEWLSSAEEIAAMEQADQDAADTQTMIQGAPAAAAMMKASAATQKVK